MWGTIVVVFAAFGYSFPYRNLSSLIYILQSFNSLLAHGRSLSEGLFEDPEQTWSYELSRGFVCGELSPMDLWRVLPF